MCKTLWNNINCIQQCNTCILFNSCSSISPEPSVSKSSNASLHSWDDFVTAIRKLSFWHFDLESIRTTRCSGVNFTFLRSFFRGICGSFQFNSIIGFRFKSPIFVFLSVDVEMWKSSSFHALFPFGDQQVAVGWATRTNLRQRQQHTQFYA